ncbi:dnaJ homolog subfamily C member 2-like [Coccinella septempunctata]|uniref:dnaJ homolog subfamily C member 2-like n=1 Tax=Coccinella septempunctata TaxID=41139 RepID=UPI001D079BDB|nr:dnaJ homolog subfamily C member 2-like [Coccinella septempunctata]
MAESDTTTVDVRYRYVLKRNSAEVKVSLDPKDWRQQDYYRVNDSEETIRSAYRQKVLHHHPDKRKAKGPEIKANDDYFTCITMAYETLGDPKRGKSYDSVDPEFDDGLPSSHEIKKDFYGTCAYYSELNGRWSEKKKRAQNRWSPINHRRSREFL